MRNSSLLIEPSTLKGRVRGAPSRSHAIRSLLFASLAQGTSYIENLPASPDVEATLEFCKEIGATVSGNLHYLAVHGVGKNIKAPMNSINVGDSRLLLRLVAPLLAMQTGKTAITAQNMKNTSKPLFSALEQLGATVNHETPLSVQGPIKAGKVELDGEDSQPISALLIASSMMEGETEIVVNNPKEKGWVDLTMNWLKGFGVELSHEGYQKYNIKGGVTYPCFEYEVPIDFSTLSFLISAALITRSEVQIDGLEQEILEENKQFLDMLIKMGAPLDFTTKKGKIKISVAKSLIGQTFDVTEFTQSIPILLVLGCFAKGKTHLHHGNLEKSKDTKRIKDMIGELMKMGAKIVEMPEGIVVESSKLIGKRVSSHDDHRVAMALSVAGLAAKGQTLVKDADCIVKSYPQFVRDLLSLGANVRKVQ